MLSIRVAFSRRNDKKFMPFSMNFYIYRLLIFASILIFRIWKLIKISTLDFCQQNTLKLKRKITKYDRSFEEIIDLKILLNFYLKKLNNIVDM